MVLVTVPQVNPNDEITNDSVNQGANALAAAVNGHLDDSNIEQISGTKISAGTTPATAMNDSGNVEKRFDEAFSDYVIDGCVWSALSGLNGSMTTGHISVQGKRLTAPAIATHAFTASKDTYVYLDASGLPLYTGEVANGTAAPTQPANTVRTYKIATSATAVTSVTDITSKPVTASKIDFTTFPKFSVYASAGLSMTANTWTKAPLGAAIFDTNNVFDIVNRRFVAQAAGFYQIDCQVGVASAGLGGAAMGALYVNGTLYKRSMQLKGSGDASTLPRFPISSLVKLNVGDYVELFGFCNEARDISGGQDITYMSGFLVSLT